jgi:peptidoglycan/xylan/chitin deacetylase (PgdA/CDA1 family)
MAGTICGARTSDPVVALSFDDGPHPANTPRLLSVLAQHHARATFFLITEHARKHPQLVDEIRSAGHEIGLHGRRHIDLARASPWKAAQTIHRGRKELEEVVGARVSLFRPPYGTQTPLTYVLARQSGMEVIGWSSSPRDFLDLSTKRHVSIALAEIAPGGIILLHDGPPSAPKRRATVVGALLAAIAEREWSALDVGGLLFGRDPVRRFWFRRRAAAVIEEMRPLLAEEEGEVNPGDGGEHGGRPTDSSAPAPALPMRAQPEGGR